jgi:acetyl esterase
MPLDPQAAALLAKVRADGNAEYWQMTPQEARDAHNRRAGILGIPPAAVFDVDNRRIPGPASDVPLRIYTPLESATPLPVFVWLHDGGHVIGSLDSYDAICRQLALEAECIVASVDYRLAPEHKFPAGVEDAFAALNWVGRQAGGFGGDVKRLAIGGDSAGANLATVCAILARDAGGPQLRFQLLVYPRTVPDEDLPSHHEFAEGYMLTRRSILWFHDHYRGSDTDRQDFRYAPLIHPDLSRLPPALVIVGECDPLRDDGIAYARRLQADGTATELALYAGMIHPFFSLGGALDAARHALTRSAQALRRALVS